MQLPFPGRLQSFGKWRFCFPAQYRIGLLWIGPHLCNVTFPAFRDSIIEFYAGSLFESMDKFEYRNTLPRTEIEYFDVLLAFMSEHTFYGFDVSFGQVYHIDVIAYARAVGGIVIVSENAELLTYSDGGLCDIG